MGTRHAFVHAYMHVVVVEREKYAYDASAYNIDVQAVPSVVAQRSQHTEAVGDANTTTAADLYMNYLQDMVHNTCM